MQAVCDLANEFSGACSALTWNLKHLSRFSVGWGIGTRRAVLRLKYPVLAGLQELESNHAAKVLIVLLHPNDAYQGYKALRSCEFQGRSYLYFVFAWETSTISTHVVSFHKILKLVPILVASVHLEFYFEGDAFEFSCNEGLNNRFVFFHDR
jgi:hypothetical protein